MLSLPPLSTPFPYTTLFRSAMADGRLSSFLRRADDLRESGDGTGELEALGRACQAEPGNAGAWLRRGRAAEAIAATRTPRSEEHTSELQSRVDLVCRLLLEK